MGCCISLDAAKASRKNQMLSREKQIPHYTAHMGTQADGTHLSAVTFFLLQSCFERIKTCLQDCSKIFQAASSDLFSRFEDLFSPFLAVFPSPSVLPKEGQCLWCRSRLCGSPSPPYNRGSHCTTGSESWWTAEPWNKELGSETAARHRQLCEVALATTSNSGSSYLRGSKFISCAEAQTDIVWHAIIRYKVSFRVAPTSEKEETKPLALQVYTSILGREQENEINPR